ncbi:40-residue YVTN family beta-propeller repeat [Bacteroidales bacterium Barb6]|nr:40-residue YVTN family beta-propeller repeat [Bacteroidales bacterium Barb6]
MKTSKFFYASAAFALLSLSLTSCLGDDDITDPEIIIEPPVHGVFVLNSGNWGANDATLDVYYPDDSSLVTNVFYSVNKRALGDVANHMLIYGSKIYIAVNQSNTVEVTNLDLESLATIRPKGELDQPQSPRCLTAEGGSVYATLFDGHLARIDTATLEITAKVPVGANPEDVCFAGGKLYVANSGGMNDVPDSTLSVVDAATFTATGTLKTAVNPERIYADSQGDLYVKALGNYSDIPASLQRIDPKTGNATTILSNDNLITALYKDKLYILSSESNASTGWKAANTKFIIYDALTEKVTSENFLAAGTNISNPYSLSIDPFNGDIYIGTSDYATNGDVYVFTNDGKPRGSFETSGLNPMGVFFINR